MRKEDFEIRKNIHESEEIRRKSGEKNIKKNKSKPFAVLVVIVLIVSSGIYFGKDYFKDFINNTLEKAKVFKNIKEENDSVNSDNDSNKSADGRINFENNSKATFVGLGKNYIYCTKDGIKFFDLDSNQIWNDTYTINSPIVVNEGNCTVVAETQGKFAKVYNEKGEMYSLKTDGSILQLAINKVGGIGIILKSNDGYKIQAYNQEGKLLMERIDQDEGVHPLSLDISEDNRILAVSYMDTNDINIEGKILFFNTNRTDAKNSDMGDFFASISKADSFIPVLKLLDNGNFIAVGDSSLFCFDLSGKEKWTLDFENKVDKVDFGDGKNTVIAFGQPFAGKDGFENGTAVIIDENGKIKSNIPMGSPVTYLNSNKNGVIAGSGREYICFNYSGNIQWGHTATQDIKDIILLSSSSKALYVTNNYAELVDMKNK